MHPGSIGRFAAKLAIASASLLACHAHGAFGDRDCSFSGDGVRFMDAPFGQPFSATVEPSGSMLVRIGFFSTSSNLYRVDASGDTATPLGSTANANVRDPADVLLADGRFLFPTGMGLSPTPPGVARFLASGALDTSFGSHGYAVLGGLGAAVTAPIVQADGRIVVGGTFNGAAGLVRFNADGSPDTSFGSGGGVSNPTAGSVYVSIAMQGDGSIVAVSETALVRHRPDGRLDTGFGTAGVTSVAGVIVPLQVRLQPTGKILVAGWSDATNGPLRLARYTTAGALDTSVAAGNGYRNVETSYGALDARYTPFAPLAVMADGRPLVAGAYRPLNPWSGPISGAVVRYGADLTDDAVVSTMAPSFVRVLPNGRLLAGGNSYLARYLGDADTQTCTATATSLASTPNPSEYGQQVTITATVTALSGAATPDGSVAFKLGGESLGSSVTLVGGVASLAISTLPEGTSTLGAQYFGGGAFIGSTSPAYAHTVNPRPPTTTVLSSSPNPSAFGQRVTLTAVVASASSAATPTGTVQFLVDGYPIAAVALTGGVATASTSALRAGTRTLTAAYSGDDAFAPGTSAAVAQVVNPGAGRALFGDRDCSYGNGGVAIVGTDGSGSIFTAALESDGDVLVRVGSLSSSSQLYRIDPFGVPAGTSLLGNTVAAVDPADAVTADGKIVFGTQSILFGSGPGVGRLRPTGGIDPFLSDWTGYARAPGLSSYGLYAGPVVQPDGRILVAGRNTSGATINRLNADGSADATFGTNGVANNANAGGAYSSIALQPDGSIVAVSDTALARHRPDGQLDTSFGNGGTVDLSGLMNGSIVRLQPSGHILVAGVVPGSSVWARQLRVARFTPAGAVDSSAAGGMGYRDVAITLGPLVRYYDSIPLAVMPDGRVLVAGRIAPSGSADAGGLVRYAPDLSDDAIAVLDFAPAFVKALPDGKFLVGRYGYGSHELRRLLDDVDPQACVPTSTTLASTPNPSDYSEPVTLTATVTANAGTEVPQGRVLFKSGATALASPVALANGIATLVTSSLPSGSNALTAAYSASGNFASSVSAVVTQVVRTALTINDPTANSAAGNATMAFTITLTSPMSTTVSVSYATADHTAVAGIDYTAVSGTLTFNPGETTKTIDVAIAGKAAPVPDKQFFMLLFDPVNATLAKSGGIGTIVYSASGALSLYVDDPTVLEGYSGVTLMGFTVSLSAPTFTNIVSVTYGTANGTATAGVDYNSVSGTLTFGHGQTKRWVMVPILANATQQSDRTLFLNLSAASNATIVKAQGTGTIKDDDPTPPAATVPQWRLFSPVTKEHLYTTDSHEYSVLGTRGWIQEGTAYSMFRDGGSYASQFAIPLYRMYHGGVKQHHWTTDPNEVSVLAALGTWNYEGIAGYVLPAAAPGSTPLYRLSYFDPPLHLWTTDLNEKNVLSSQYGWVYEGTVGEVLP